MDDFRSNFDGLASNTVFCCWTGATPMSSDRVVALWSVFNNVRCPTAFLNANALRDWELPESPFHPAFDYLSETHKADYLRCYLMHHFGGGYTDLKPTGKAWPEFFDRLRRSDALGLGYTEIGPHGVAPIQGPFGDKLRANHAKLIGLCAFIFRRRSPLTAAWYERTQRLLSEKLDALREHPARHPQDQFGVKFQDGSLSRYPIRWTELLGDIFHPVIYEFRDKILHDDIAPQFHSYR
jgi:hypothetical protein